LQGEGIHCNPFFNVFQWIRDVNLFLLLGPSAMGHNGELQQQMDSVETSSMKPYRHVEARETEEMLLTASIDIDRVDQVRSTTKVLSDRRPSPYELS